MIVGNEDQGRKFITTEPIASTQIGEQKVWDAVKNIFAERDCIAYWRYPIFTSVSNVHPVPDILIADQLLNLVIINILSVTVEQILKIQENLWQFQNFSVKELAPYQQAEQQLRALSSRCDRESDLWRKVRGRVVIALPEITEEQWQQKGWDEQFSSEPILFQNYLSQTSLLERIEQTPITIPGEVLNEIQWGKLLTVLAGMPVLKKADRSGVSRSPKSRSTVLSLLQEKLHELDLQQEHISKEIPPGVQRIRGVAGSGKTVLLCQKAVNMHLKHPEWEIALVFFTRTLYETMIELVDRWLRWLSDGDIHYDRSCSKLQVLHAWGSKEQAGLYRMICQGSGIRPKGVGDTRQKQPSRGLAELCKCLCEETKIEPLFDAILIDEGQDLVSEDDLKFQDKQAIYWLAYQALRPVDSEHSDQRRLIWAYDEAQSLDSLKIPTAKELFGDELSDLLSKGPMYRGGIKKSEIMRRCYRTPGPILMAAHGIGMGLFRVEGMLTGITRADEWRAIGYEVTGKFIPGQKITLHRPVANSPNPVCELWEDPVIEFNTYRCRQDELQALADKIMHNLVEDELNPSRDILVIILGSASDAIYLENQVAGFLIEHNIDIYIPTALELNELNPKWPNNDPNCFWKEGGVTLSRVTRAKGNEANMVYVVGLDQVARDESNISLRNQLFVALTRTRGWVDISGIGNYSLYEELQEIIESGDTFTFVYQRPLRREIAEPDTM